MARRHAQQTSALVELLSASGLDFAIIGGAAAIMHGFARMTLALDIIMEFSRTKLERLLELLRPHDPRHATRPDLSVLDESIEYLCTFRMLLLETTLGRLDVLPGVDPFEGYHAVPTIEREAFGHRCRVIELGALIRSQASRWTAQGCRGGLRARAIRERRGSKE